MRRFLILSVLAMLTAGASGCACGHHGCESSSWWHPRNPFASHNECCECDAPVMEAPAMAVPVVNETPCYQ